MIALDEAGRLILSRARPLPEEFVAATEASGRVLAQEITATADQPRFDQSAMDGYGVRVEDAAGAGPDSPAVLRLAGAVRAGAPAEGPLEAGTACRIFTGGEVPPGVTAVVMQEHCRADGDRVEVLVTPRPGEHIRRRGEEFERGDVVLPRGTPVTPAGVGLLVTFDLDRVAVHRRPSVSVIATGNELTGPDAELPAAGIRDSNSPSLAAALAEAGVSDVDFARARDDRAATARALSGALGKRDVVITTGGVSVGDFDLVKGVCEELGVETVFWRVAMKPGKPNYFGVFEKDGARTLVFGLPGNPVSALVSFLLLVRPALLALRGRQDVLPLCIPALLTRECTKKPGRAEWLRGRLTFGSDGVRVAPLPARGSHMLSGLALANALLELPLESERVEAGATVRVLPLPWA